jgi:uncharacterized protein YndB with AHSA1/START domain
MRLTNTVTIDRPLAAVFEYLADLENVPRWNYAIGETRKVTSGPVGVGSRYLQTRTIPVHAHSGWGPIAEGVHRIHRSVDGVVHRVVDKRGETGRFLGVGGVVRRTG